MLQKVSISVVPSGGEWAISPFSHEGALFIGSRETAVALGHLIALRDNVPLHVYQAPRHSENLGNLSLLRISQKVIDYLHSLIEQEDIEEIGLISDLLDIVEFRYHVVEQDDGWIVFKLLEDEPISTFQTQDEAVQFAYQHALEDGSVVYVYDQSDSLVKEIDPEDDLEYSDKFLAELKTVEEANDYLNLDDFKRELGLND